MASSQQLCSRQRSTNLIYQTASSSGGDDPHPRSLSDDLRQPSLSNAERLLQQLHPALELSGLYERMARAVEHRLVDEVGDLSAKAFVSAEARGMDLMALADLYVEQAN